MKTYLKSFGMIPFPKKKRIILEIWNENILPVSFFIKMWYVLNTSGPFKTKSQGCVLWALSSKWLIHSREAWIVWLAYGSTLN